MTFSALCSFFRNPPLEYAMSRYVAPVGFTLACAWVFTLFLLASH